MEKYKSDFIKPEDISIYTKRRYINDIRIEIVEIIYIPTGLKCSSEDISQIRAYNEALKQIEIYIRKDM